VNNFGETMAANPATGGYWGGSHAKGNRTRRQDQEAYRKALDSQIVESIEMDKKCLEKNKKGTSLLTMRNME
jgi:hypothetical protein